ncbi:hypothetical protein BC831DRAFT_473819 [Entophlyctis helioformis]|nr:hypothetical protein BC831DRAFT_473819 [Entophlyctis helioformis]
MPVVHRAPASAPLRRRRNDMLTSTLTGGPQFGRTVQHASIFSSDMADSFNVSVMAKMDRGFFLSGTEWTCYRRNYFQLSAAFTCTDTSNNQVPLPCVAVDPETNANHIISSFCIGISARITAGFKSVDLVQQTAKRDKGPQGTPEPLPCVPGGDVYQYNRVHASTIATFERVQFRTSTANNGKRRAAQQYFGVVANLFGLTDNGQFMLLASTESAPLVVRGRSPGHYNDTASLSAGAAGSGDYEAAVSAAAGYGGELMDDADEYADQVPPISSIAKSPYENASFDTRSQPSNQFSQPFSPYAPSMYSGVSSTSQLVSPALPSAGPSSLSTPSSAFVFPTPSGPASYNAPSVSSSLTLSGDDYRCYPNALGSHRHGSLGNGVHQQQHQQQHPYYPHSALDASSIPQRPRSQSVWARSRAMSTSGSSFLTNDSCGVSNDDEYSLTNASAAAAAAAAAAAHSHRPSDGAMATHVFSPPAPLSAPLRRTSLAMNIQGALNTDAAHSPLTPVNATIVNGGAHGGMAGPFQSGTPLQSQLSFNGSRLLMSPASSMQPQVQQPQSAVQSQLFDAAVASNGTVGRSSSVDQLQAVSVAHTLAVPSDSLFGLHSQPHSQSDHSLQQQQQQQQQQQHPSLQSVQKQQWYRSEPGLSITTALTSHTIANDTIGSHSMMHPPSSALRSGLGSASIPVTPMTPSTIELGRILRTMNFTPGAPDATPPMTTSALVQIPEFAAPHLSADGSQQPYHLQPTPTHNYAQPPPQIHDATPLADPLDASLHS